MKDELKDLIEDVFGDCLSISEVCELYAEIYSFTKDQMKFVINCMEEKEDES